MTNSTVYTRIGKNWAVGMPWWLAPFVFMLWLSWVIFYLTYLVFYWTVRLQVQAVRWAHAKYLARRKAD